MLTCTKELHFCCAHRLLGHEGACANLHGHNYKLVVTIRGDDDTFPTLDKVGRIIDFSKIKEMFQGWLDRCLDHQTVVNLQDSTLIDFLEAEGQDYYAITGNPTAEIMVQHLFKAFSAILDKAYQGIVKLYRLDLWETESAHASCTE